MSLRKIKDTVFASAVRRLIKDTLTRDLDISEDQADVAALDAAYEICRHFSKQLIYIGSTIQPDLVARDFLIWEKFKGNNQAELAAEFNLSPQQIYTILRIMRNHFKTKNEPQLPGF